MNVSLYIERPDDVGYFIQHDSNRQNSVCFYLERRLHVHVPLLYTKARSLHLACLKTPPTARGFAMIGCRLSLHWILTFTSLAESSSSIVTSSMRGGTPLIFGLRVKGQGQIWRSFYKTLLTPNRLKFYVQSLSNFAVAVDERRNAIDLGSKVKVIFDHFFVKPCACCGHNTDFSFIQSFWKFTC